MSGSGAASTCEIELKAGLQPRSFAGLARMLEACSRRPGQVARLRTLYVDTGDQRLSRAGIALRMRHGPAGWRLSLKADRTQRGGVQQAMEIEALARGPRPDLRLIPDDAVRDRLRTLLEDETPKPLFETRVTRTSWVVAAAHGVVEVALDRGTIQGGGRRMPVSELEIELLAGSPEAVFDVAETLLGSSAADLSVPSKADRGLALLAGTAAADLPPLPEPDPEQPASEVFAGLLAALAAQMSRRLFQTLTVTDPEGPHQLRVALRRLRAALWLYRPLLDRQLARAIAAEARAIGRIVSPLRDADVFHESLSPAQLAQDDPALATALAHWHQRVRAQVRRTLRAERATAFVVRLNRLAALGGWARRGKRGRETGFAPADRVTRPRLEAHWARQRGAGDRLASLDSEARHAFRKQMKKLRYAVEFALPVEARRPFLQACKRLQESLGDLNDQAMLHLAAPALSEPGLAERLQARLDRLRGGQRVSDLALGRACRHWQALGALTPPWEDESARPPQRRAEPHR